MRTIPPSSSHPFLSLQAAYLVGVSDPNSQAGQQGLVEPTQFARANQAIQMACQSLGESGCTQSQVTRGVGARAVVGEVFVPAWSDPRGRREMQESGGLRVDTFHVYLLYARDHLLLHHLSVPPFSVNV